MRSLWLYCGSTRWLDNAFAGVHVCNITERLGGFFYSLPVSRPVLFWFLFFYLFFLSFLYGVFFGITIGFNFLIRCHFRFLFDSCVCVYWRDLQKDVIYMLLTCLSVNHAGVGVQPFKLATG